MNDRGEAASAPEPLTLTLEELAVLHGIVVWKDPASEAWVAGYPRYISPHSLEWEPLGIGATWPEAASDALRRPVVARDEAAELAAIKAWAKALDAESGAQSAAYAAAQHEQGYQASYEAWQAAKDRLGEAEERLYALAASEGES